MSSKQIIIVCLKHTHWSKPVTAYYIILQGREADKYNNTLFFGPQTLFRWKTLKISGKVFMAIYLNFYNEFNLKMMIFWFLVSIFWLKSHRKLTLNSNTVEQLHLEFYRHVTINGGSCRNVVPHILLHSVAKCGGLCNIESSPRVATWRQVAPRGSIWFKKNETAMRNPRKIVPRTQNLSLWLKKVQSFKNSKVTISRFLGKIKSILGTH